jgi:hypothetical protein
LRSVITSTGRPSGNFPKDERAASAAPALLLSDIAPTPASVMVNVTARNGVTTLGHLDIILPLLMRFIRS